MASLLLDTLTAKRKVGGRPPIWLMRQAGRYMPSYQRLRSRYSFDALFRESDLITKVTLLPIEELDLDAAIIFSDILIALDGLGISWKIVEGIGPVIEFPLKPSDPVPLLHRDERYTALSGAIVELKKSLNVPLLGFSGGPFTLASYLIEGKNPRELKKTKEWLYSDPKTFVSLLNRITESVLELLRCQIDAGVDAIQIFDTHAGELSCGDFAHFVLPVLRTILSHLPSHIPTLLFTRSSSMTAKLLASLAPTGLSLDWSYELCDARRELPSTLVLQGNLDPALLLGSPFILKQRVEKLLEERADDPRYIFNLGHGILPQTPYDQVKMLVERVKSYDTALAR